MKDSAQMFPELSTSEALEVSVAAATHLGAMQAGHVAAARALARRLDDLDESGFVDENGKLDNVSMPTFLKYLDALGLAVDRSAVGSGSRAVTPKDQLSEMRKKLSAGA